LLNNRQAGRRRGRSGQAPRSNNGGRESGNRIDNRARGNAPQMLEKYKTLASEAQRQGDRVMTEYYLQFADHYFRVVAETRARFEETRPRQEWSNEDGDQGEGDDRGQNDASGYDDEDAAQEREVEQARREPRDARPPRDNRDRPERNDRSERSDRPERNDNRDRPERIERPARAPQSDRPERSSEDRGNRSPSRDYGNRDGNRDAGRDSGRGESSRNYSRDVEPVAVADTIDIAVLPPSFGSDGPISPIVDIDPVDIVEVAPKRRGRPRKVEVISDAE
jgi:Domain of unknown function (DUF4167)